MTTSNGRELAFYINVNNVPMGSMGEMKDIIDKNARIIEVIYEEY